MNKFKFNLPLKEFMNLLPDEVEDLFFSSEEVENELDPETKMSEIFEELSQRSPDAAQDFLIRVKLLRKRKAKYPVTVRKTLRGQVFILVDVSVPKVFPVSDEIKKMYVKETEYAHTFPYRFLPENLELTPEGIPIADILLSKKNIESLLGKQVMIMSSPDKSLPYLTDYFGKIIGVERVYRR